MRRFPMALGFLLLALLASGCSDGDGEEGSSGDRPSSRASSDGGRPGGGGSGGSFGGFGGGAPPAAVPVEVETVVRRPISSFLETNGVLEAENDVDLLARAAGPILELRVEEGIQVRKGALLARIDPAETRARVEIARVERDEAKLAFERAQSLFDTDLLSREAHDTARSRYETAEAQLAGDELVLGYTEVRAPFSGVVARRHIKLAQTVSVGEPLFRLTDFDPLLCPIQVPERELPRLEIGQIARVTVEAWRDESFTARVLRISPVVDSSTGTVRVTLEVDAAGKLRPGMFAAVFLETERRDDALVIPKAALSLESIGDTVYVAQGDTAARREVELGFQEGDFVEITTGLEEGEPVVVVGQDGLSDGTPVKVVGGAGAPAPEAASGPPAMDGSPDGRPRAPGATAGERRGPPPGFDPSNLTPEQIEGIKKRMKERGLSDSQIEERLKQMRERTGGG